MSRGHGATQRWLLKQLRANTPDPSDDQRRARPMPPGSYGHKGQIAAAESWTRLVDMVGRNATPAAYESARRALYRLRQQGVVQTAHLTDEGGWAALPGRRDHSVGRNRGWHPDNLAGTGHAVAGPI